MRLIARLDIKNNYVIKGIKRRFKKNWKSNEFQNNTTMMEQMK